MTEILLQTKLFVPQIRPFLVLRPQLHEKLDNGLNGRVTLVSAPAGYGKTTLVASWLEQQTDVGRTWYTLDVYDNDPSRFLRYFIAAWQRIDPKYGQAAQELLQANPISSRSHPPEAILTMLINDLVSGGQSCILVIDDIHLLENEKLYQTLAFWVENCPANVHTIFISREEPSLPLARWRVRGQLQDINSQDLQFSPNEAADFLRRVMQLDLSTEDISLLAEQTEGWVASLQMAAHSLQGADSAREMVAQFSGSNRQIMDYLLEEVWQRQSVDIQNFLLQTAVLHRFNAELCDALRQQSDSRQMFDSLDRRNLFLRPLDNQRIWYGYHPIFAEFLQKRLQLTLPEHILPLHQRASDWFAAQGLMEEAIHHALSAQMYETAASYILAQAPETMWHQGRSETLRRWCQELPEETLFALPDLATFYAWSFVLHGEIPQMDAFLNRAEVFWQASELEVPTTALGELATLRGEAALLYGRIQESLKWFESADELIPPENRRLTSRV